MKKTKKQQQLEDMLKEYDALNQGTKVFANQVEQLDVEKQYLLVRGGKIALQRLMKQRKELERKMLTLAHRRD